ncbi:MAG: hypothetical protein ACPGTP_08270 [Bacteroidia bacterium]
MKKLSYLIILTVSIFWIGCESKPQEEDSHVPLENAIEASPKQMLTDAYQLFKEGDDEASIKLANEVLRLGRETENDTLIGKALTSLCRNAQRKLDTTSLAELSTQLEDLSKTTGNRQWMMYRAHMNAEMWRLIGDMERAEAFYNESLEISHETGAIGMYTIDHFNKSFVSTAKGDFDAARDLIARYYELRKENSWNEEDAYGLIALAYLLEQQKNYKGAHEVAVVTRRLFKEQNLFPEPPDEKPLLMVEAKVKEELDPRSYKNIAEHSVKHNVSSLLEKFLK